MSSAISTQNPDRIRVFCMSTFNFAFKFKLNPKLNDFKPLENPLFIRVLTNMTEDIIYLLNR